MVGKDLKDHLVPAPGAGVQRCQAQRLLRSGAAGDPRLEGAEGDRGLEVASAAQPHGPRANPEPVRGSLRREKAAVAGQR